MEKLEALLDWGGTRKDVACLVLGGAALLASLFDWLPLPFDPAWIAIVLCGVPIVLEAVIGLVTAFDIKADVLVSLALIASVCIGEDFAAGEVAFIMQLGGLLEDLTVAKARAGIEKLVHLTPRTARVLSPAGEKVVPAEEVQVGDLLQVRPGETVPVDGIITSGQTSINQAVMTGESLPVDKTVGDTVSSGTVNQFGAFEMEATKVGEDSSIQRMIRLVQSADAGKARIVGLADRWATWIVGIALSAAALTWLISGEIIRAVTILVVFCPCALVLATPTAIMAAIGNATRHGFLVREGDALERLDVSGDALKVDGEPFAGQVIYTGQADELFKFRFGPLPYRTLNFQFETLDQDDFQGYGTVNYTVDREYTRITEFKHLTGQVLPDKTTIVKEYSKAYSGILGEIPYYAIINPANRALYEQYRGLAERSGNLHLLGRLAEYQYYNMDAIAARALDLAERL